MKRILFIINFIVLGSIWNVCDALCVKPVSQVMPQQAESISGILTMAGLPCLSNEDPEYPCLPCLTLGFVNHDTLYYLTSDNESMLNKLNELEELWSQDTMVFITGIPYKKDNINYMNVKEVTFGNEPPQPSAWCMVNAPEEGGKDVTMSGLVYIGATPCGLDRSAGPCVPCITLVFETKGQRYFLSTEDPVINTRLDSILYELESVNCICGQPVILSGSMHYGEFYDYMYARELLIKGKVQSIDYPYPETPDTVALYARVKDSPGSSTVDPVDPNQIVALLTDNRLIVYEYLGESIFYSLNKADYRPNHMPASERNVRADSFSGSVYFHLIESGRYTLELSNPGWDYLITGSFDYQTGEQGTEETPANDVRCTKVLIDGQLYIRQGDKTYTLTGIQVK